MNKYGIIAAIIAVALCALFAASSCANNNKKKSNVQTMNRYEVILLNSSATADGVKKASFEPQGVCSTRIDIEVKGDVIQSVKFTNGCPGNTHGVANLVVGMKVEEAIRRLEGIDCGGKGTSCPDQLAKALKYFL